uniref:Ig-like domain-containing protein n=1 Tax=Varanus komodoensis TaxID=61221 RepID=A0A8D2L8U3_VARKO
MEFSAHVGSISLSPSDHYPKPSIAASPSTEVFTGQDWTVRCWASSPGVTFVLYQAREFRYEVTPRGDSSAAEFSLKNVTVADTGRYTCYYHSIIEPVIWSNASDGVQLRVIGEKCTQGQASCHLGSSLECSPSSFITSLLHSWLLQMQLRTTAIKRCWWTLQGDIECIAQCPPLLRAGSIFTEMGSSLLKLELGKTGQQPASASLKRHSTLPGES